MDFFDSRRHIEHVTLATLPSIPDLIFNLQKELRSMKRKVRRTNRRIAEMESKLYYAPPGPGYLKAKQSFENQSALHTPLARKKKRESKKK